MTDINPEGYQRGGKDCVCGALYSYAGIVEPGQYAPDCPEHGSTDLDLDAIEARYEAATEGPWMPDGSQIYPVAPGTVLVAATRAFTEGEPTPDADFIAHARTDVPALVAEVRRLQTDRDRWKARWKGVVEDDSARVAAAEKRGRVAALREAEKLVNDPSYAPLSSVGDHDGAAVATWLRDRADADEADRREEAP